MKITVDKALCSGHARCHAVDEELFPIDDFGYLAPKDQPVPEDLVEVAQRGTAACPERAIRLGA